MFKNIPFISIIGICCIFILFGLYIWRKICSMYCYIEVLEKKIQNLKKINKELFNNTGNTENLTDASKIMSELFNVSIGDNSDGICISSCCEIKKNNNSDTVEIKERIEKPEEKIISNKVHKQVDEIPDELIEPIELSTELPIAKHDDIDDKDIPDNESAISDNPKIYNKKKLTKLSLEKVKEICSSMNISTDGTKNTLIDKILSQ